MRLTPFQLLLGLWVIIHREIAKFARQRERLFSSMVRPLLWLIVFASGLHDLLGVSIIPPYRTYTPYQEYILPGLIGMVVLFQSMQSALSLVYDREVGVMRVMLVTPLPRPFLLFAKILAATVLALLQAAIFLAIAAAFGVFLPLKTLIFVVPAVVVGTWLLLALKGRSRWLVAAPLVGAVPSASALSQQLRRRQPRGRVMTSLRATRLEPIDLEEGHQLLQRRGLS